MLAERTPRFLQDVAGQSRGAREAGSQQCGSGHRLGVVGLGGRGPESDSAVMSETYTEGMEVEYKSKSAGWMRARITKVEGGKIWLDIRSGGFYDVDRMEGKLRVPHENLPVAGAHERLPGGAHECLPDAAADVGDGSAMASGFSVPQGPPVALGPDSGPVAQSKKNRARDEYDDEVPAYVQQGLKDHGSVMGFLEHLQQHWQGQMDVLKVRLEKKFPSSVAVASPFSTSPGRKTQQGPIHPAMLALHPTMWDLFYVYETDFAREVKALVQRGVVGAFRVKPCSAPGGVEGSGPILQPTFSSFSWGPDGDYASFVKVAAIVVVCVSSVQLEWELPAWLCADLSEMQASFIFKGSQLNPLPGLVAGDDVQLQAEPCSRPFHD